MDKARTGGFLGKLERLIRGAPKDKESKRVETFIQSNETINRFLEAYGENYQTERHEYSDDGQLIEEAGTRASQIVFKYYPRFKRVSGKATPSSVAELEKRNETVYHFAVSLKEFVDFYLANQRIGTMDYGIADGALPTFNPNAEPTSQNRLSSKDQYLVYQARLANGVADIELNDIENYSLRDACGKIEGFLGEFCGYLNSAEAGNVVASASKVRAMRKFKKETCAEVSEALKQVSQFKKTISLPRNAAELESFKNAAREPANYVSRIAQAYNSQRQQLIDMGVDESEFSKTSKEQAKYLWDFVVEVGRVKLPTGSKVMDKIHQYPTPFSGVIDKSPKESGMPRQNTPATGVMSFEEFSINQKRKSR